MEEQGIVLATPTPITQPARQPWDRQPNELSRWYDAFLIYRNLRPHNRSVLAAYKEHKRMMGCDTWRQIVNPSSDWYAQCKAWDWDKRATLHDDYIIKQTEAQAEAAIREWYAKSRFDLVKCWDDLQVEWEEIENGGMSRSQVTQAMKTIASLATPTSPSQSIDVQIILDKLPADVQSALLDSLTK